MTNLYTLKQFSDKHPAFPVGGLRHQIFNADTNGLNQSGAIVRNGRRVLIDEKRYFAWLAMQNGKIPDWFDELTHQCPQCGDPSASYPDCEGCGYLFGGEQ